MTRSLHALLLAALLAVPSVAATDPLIAQSTAILEQALADRNPDTRKQAVIALSLAANRVPFLTRLAAMLDDKDVEVRLAAIASLSEVNSGRAIAALKKALNDDVPEVSFAAAKALYALRNPAGKQALLAVLEGENKTASSFFSKQKREALRMIHTPMTMLLFAARSGAAFTPIPGLGQGIASMEALLTDPGVSGRATAALLLGREKDSATLAALKEALDDKDWSVRAAAVHSLALRNRPALKRELAPLLDDKKDAVRMRAAAACIRLSTLSGAQGSQSGGY